MAHYWPEFGAHGTAQITVEEALRHEAGLCFIPSVITLQDLRAYVQGDPVPLAKHFEDATAVWHSASRRCYHALTRGFVIAEVIRRVDPRHRLIHQFIKEVKKTVVFLIVVSICVFFVRLLILFLFYSFYLSSTYCFRISRSDSRTDGRY